MSTTTLVPWFGSNRSLAAEVGAELEGRSWVGVPFAGGMCELAHIPARTILANDLHGAAINLARVAGHPRLGPALYRRLRRMPFHPAVLASAQAACLGRGQSADTSTASTPSVAAESLFGSGDVIEKNAPDAPDLEWAVDYFVTAWMGRSGAAGTDGEYRGNLSVRWNANGGDSAVRYQSAAAGLVAWRRVFRRCNFTCVNAFDFLARTIDSAGHGIYCDPPFPDVGHEYRHKFSSADHQRLAELLARFKSARVVCRFYEHPLIRSIYPEGKGWTWRRLVGGKRQTNEAAPEVLIMNGKSLAATEAA